MSTTFVRGENPLKADKLNTAFSERVSRGGDTMQGFLKLAADPVQAFDAATKQYVDRFTSMGVPTGAYIGSAPPGNVLGPLWWDTNSGQLFIQYNDGSSTQWVSANSVTADQLAAVIGTPTFINVQDYGAKGDGTTNDTAAFTAAIAAASATHKKLVRVPAGLYLLDPINLTEGVTLSGDIPGPVDPRPGFLTNALGATLLVNSHANTFITLYRSSCLQDVLIYDPGQVAPTASVPNVFPAQVWLPESARVRGVTLCNAYVGIQVSVGRCIVENCYIGAYHIAVDVDQSQDVTYFNNIWCGVFYDTCLGLFPWQNMDAWVMNNNGIGFRFSRADAVSMVSCGTFIKWAGVYLQDGTVSGATGASYGWCVNMNIDVCVYGVIATSTNALGWTFTNMAALPNGDPRWPAQTPLYLAPGGSLAPGVTWTAGTNGLTSSWVSPNGVISAGTAKIRGVNNISDSATTFSAITLNSPTGPTLRAGAGAATGTQPKGSLWLRTDGAAGSTLYVTQGGGTWAAVAGV